MYVKKVNSHFSEVVCVVCSSGFFREDELKIKVEEKKVEETVMITTMKFLSYKVVRCTCLRFPEQLQVVVTGDVLQQRLPACPVAVAVFLDV